MLPPEAVVPELLAPVVELDPLVPEPLADPEPLAPMVALEPPVFVDDKGKAEWAKLRERAPNVSVLMQMPADMALAPSSFDFALLHLVYHDFYWESAQYKFPRMDPDAALKKLHAAMRPGGTDRFRPDSC